MKSDTLIRDASPLDGAAVRRLCAGLDHHDYLLDAWGGWMENPADVQLVAVREGRLRGCVHAGFIAAGEAFLQGLRVETEFRRLGIGRDLMRALANRLSARGVVVQRAVTARANLPALDLLTDLGWRPVRAVARRLHRSATSAGMTPWSGCEVLGIIGEKKLLISRRGLAFFQRIYGGASPSWLQEECAAGRVLGLPGPGGACLFADSSAGDSRWFHTIVGNQPAVLRLLARLVATEESAARGSLILEAEDEPELQSALDALGFEPAGAGDRYVVMEGTPP